MQVRVLYFAKLREAVGIGEETVQLDDVPLPTVGVLLAVLQARGGIWAASLMAENVVKYAVDKHFASLETPLSDGIEVAFFPPLTGG